MAIEGFPKHCCPYWDCEYIDVSNDDETATYDCGGGALPIFFGKRLRRVLNDEDHKRWEYRSEEEIASGSSIVFEVTVDCDRTPERLATGAGPCATLQAYYNDGEGTEFCFGPITMDRQCQCLDDVPDPDFHHVGFTWGTTTLTAEQIAEDQEDTECPCVFALGPGSVITVYCNCAGCPCFGFPVDMEVRFECALASIDVVITLTYTDASTLPTPNDNYRPLPSKVWFGSYDLGGGCSIECVVDCDFAIHNAGPRLLGIYLVSDGSCAIDPVVLSSICGTAGPGFAGNYIILSSTCHDDDTEFQLVYGLCSVTADPTCAGGTILSTVTIREA